MYKLRVLSWQVMSNPLWPRSCSPQAPLSTGFSRQEYWSGLPCPSPGDLPDPGIKPASLTSPALAGGFFTTGATWETPKCPRLKSKKQRRQLQIHNTLLQVEGCSWNQVGNSTGIEWCFLICLTISPLPFPLVAMEAVRGISLILRAHLTYTRRVDWHQARRAIVFWGHITLQNYPKTRQNGRKVTSR